MNGSDGRDTLDKIEDLERMGFTVTEGTAKERSGPEWYWLGRWRDDCNVRYKVGHCVDNNDVYYTCISEHWAEENTEPGVGEYWDIYWRLTSGKKEGGAEEESAAEDEQPVAYSDGHITKFHKYDRVLTEEEIAQEYDKDSMPEREKEGGKRLSWRGKWQQNDCNVEYKVGDWVKVKGEFYRCTCDHWSENDVKPGSGQYWPGYWDCYGEEGPALQEEREAEEQSNTIKRLEFRNRNLVNEIDELKEEVDGSKYLIESYSHENKLYKDKAAWWKDEAEKLEPLYKRYRKTAHDLYGKLNVIAREVKFARENIAIAHTAEEWQEHLPEGYTYIEYIEESAPFTKEDWDKVAEMAKTALVISDEEPIDMDDVEGSIKTAVQHYIDELNDAEEASENA